METKPPGIESADLGVHDCRKRLSIPQHIKEALGGECLCARVQQLSKEPPPPQSVSTSPYQGDLFVPSRGSGEGDNSCLLSLLDVGR